MHTPETVELFIQKRAAGTALQRIADEIGVSKTTLVAWSEKYALEIAATQQDAGLEHHNRLLAKLNHRESRLDDAYNRVSPIIDDFNPDELSIMQAFRLFFMIQRETIKLQSLRLKIEEAATKLLLPPTPSKRSSCERSEHPRSLSYPQENSEATISSSEPNVALPVPAKSGGLAPAPRKRSNNGQETRKPDHIRDNFLSLIANPPQSELLPSKSEGHLITRPPEEFGLMPAKLPKETLEIAREILPKEASYKPTNLNVQQPQIIADLTSKRLVHMTPPIG